MPIEHIVRQGDCLSKLARRYGLPSWRTIYEHPNNADFRRLRSDPNIVYPGDVVFIPDRESRMEQGATESRHRFRMKSAEAFLRVRILNEEGEAVANQPYMLVMGQEQLKGRTDGSGKIDIKIDALIEDADLTVELSENRRYTWSLKLGHLDPIEELGGVQARLNNMGYYCPVDGVNGPQTEQAVSSFQKKYDLTVDGIVGEQTRNKLMEVYGC